LFLPRDLISTDDARRVLDRISDVDFKRWTAAIVTAIGLVYLGKALMAWL